jgi:hypothetical protein
VFGVFHCRATALKWNTSTLSLTESATYKQQSLQTGLELAHNGTKVVNCHIEWRFDMTLTSLIIAGKCAHL